MVHHPFLCVQQPCKDMHFNHIKMELSGFPLPKTDMWMCQTLHFLSYSLVGCSKETRVAGFKMTTCGTEVYIVRAVWLSSFSNVKCHLHESDIWKVMFHLFRLLRTVLLILAVARGDHRNNTDKLQQVELQHKRNRKQNCTQF